ncbi:MAG: phosphoenolpyruvate carboxylase [Hydrotalea flava]|uniref:phosphoenolpyruvate carboxylase n=1 Tax=Hydrotalea TaxID=1004300 RepID=UPI000B3099BE|nr:MULTISPECIES: phosphoenolpyruvate carboxylase [Hydrotalea]NIM36641.1 phosphoenolpyruvate carboxylase [Hydrotalea flava]NIM39501.1 phosphoenolpyruvate carboxylase [Hydrotalea flava]NIN04690.1 phosphoenolpyruvate carboxylase [Hydrotalea flava]NIN16362.1 phosphoenolpyruvate carboxylase [Hydrotalea flava]NIO95427.1 phosphoenolpyruvate carboxylase [Hydrotalea flava]
MSASANLSVFQSQVAIKFQLYNSLFTSLPFHRIEKTGILVSLLLLNCEEGYKKKQGPLEIIQEFFNKQTNLNSEQEKIDLLFRFVQYIERQVVLFDALEDAAFKEVNDMQGKGTVKQLLLEADQKQMMDTLKKRINDFSIQLVLTAHPTQFYRGAVLGIIHDLSSAINTNNEKQIYTYLQQLGRTPFFQQQKPTPFDEAVSLIWYLENVFYHAAGRIITYIKENVPDLLSEHHAIIRMGFWPGGDRDGNPFVTRDISLKVANVLRESIIRSYFSEVRKLKRRLTFKGVDVALTNLEKRLYDNLFVPEHEFDLTKNEILQALEKIRYQLIYEHNHLFVNLVESFINKVELFGLHFATLDIRQDSSIHAKIFDFLIHDTNVLPKDYAASSDAEKLNMLAAIETTIDSGVLKDPVQKDTLDIIAAIRDIQHLNGEAGCNRYIISHCFSAINVMEVFGMFLLMGWKKENLTIDIVPLFETIDDLKNAAAIMETLYQQNTYRSHLQKRHNKQTIMLGFSDGTKDGGYLMANWSIYKTKEALTDISKQYGIDVVFFDGRGGPPARGGGKTHQFYASMGSNISNKEIQLTIQGQTVSSNFGTIDSAQYNIEQLIHAGMSNEIFSNNKITLEKMEEQLMEAIAETSYQAYLQLKNHPYFIDYLVHVSPLKLYSETNIGSRPTKRGGSSKLTLNDLRAIPFVGSWSQIKQNVTGYYGVGTALQAAEHQGKWDAIKALYQHSLFFKTLIDNCEMAMQKCFFPLTAFLANDEKYGEIWNMVYSEYELTKKYILLLNNKSGLMADYPVDQMSIQMRERIVLPLVTIQQYAITKVRELEAYSSQESLKNTYEKLAMRCSFGIINAGRNSA